MDKLYRPSERSNLSLPKMTAGIKNPDGKERIETEDAWSPRAPQKPNEDHKDESSVPNSIWHRGNLTMTMNPDYS
ncbi:MAG: hypothetical protein J7K58_03400 [Euryarchaeota archaeon]|nr:hypothetical protein [Euryarchaeota archaeon]